MDPAARSRATAFPAGAAGSRWRTSARAPRGVEEVPDPPPGRGDPRHRLRCAPLARPGGREGRQAGRRSRSATTTRSPTRSRSATSWASSTGSSTRCRVTARSSPDWCTRPARTPTCWSGGSSRPMGPIVESDLVDGAGPDRGAGPQVPRRRARRAGHRRAQPVAGLLPRDAGGRALRPDHVRRCSRRLAERGTAVVCSAGNDATGRPCSRPRSRPGPTARGRSQPAAGHVADRLGRRAEPERTTDALFSNTGPWVRAYAPGAAVVSTMPPFQGGLQSAARTEAYGRRRETIDPDDFRGGFAVWSGTSFAARCWPVGSPATCSTRLPERRPTIASAAVARAWQAVAALTEHRAMMRCVLTAEELHQRAVSRRSSRPVRATARGLLEPALRPLRPTPELLGADRSQPGVSWKPRRGDRARRCACATTHWRGRADRRDAGRRCTASEA